MALGTSKLLKTTASPSLSSANVPLPSELVLRDLDCGLDPIESTIANYPLRVSFIRYKILSFTSTLNQRLLRGCSLPSGLRLED